MQDTKYILAVDPGKRGAYFLLPTDGDESHAVGAPFPMTKAGDLDVPEFLRILSPYKHKIVLAVKENVHAIVGNSAHSMFSFGEQNGMLKAALYMLADGAELKFQVSEVMPQTWQKVAWTENKVYGQAAVDKTTGKLKRDKDGNIVLKVEPKATSKVAALARFPKFNFIPKKCRVEHDGVIDAALIAFYGLRTIMG